MKPKTLIELDNVWKIYQMGLVKVPALRGVSIKIEKGDFVAIIGASGSGKSTIMNLIGCLDIPTKGKVLLKSQDVSKMDESDLASRRGNTIGFVFQQYNLLPSMTAFDNVLLPMDFQDMPGAAASERAKKLLTLVGLSDKLFNKPTQLSGGEQQRVSIARSLACDPEIILADEPTGALDSVTGKEIMGMLSELWKKDGKTIIIVTHDLNLAKYARTIIELKDGQVLKKYQNKKMKSGRKKK
ncbi:ABC transporter ATP-binding protein [Candidatus Woesearchaeota archaeon]|nr:ABC transporter ATP-binding protein [Candidatus Woesearchaeota archaeon]MBW2994178.1 ABC transporter ATP-binding protein [Candidatus Woesearchaeota archaeon]